ncbi:hypothetical protein DIPPA_05823 [Diplonema papillatum]|nr:hypothetical protein DIPPA_05823 [Diplonema papillatum]
MRQAVVLVASSPEFSAWVAQLKTAAAKQTARDWAEKMSSVSFWSNVAKIVEISAIIVIELRLFDGADDEKQKADDPDRPLAIGSIEGVKASFRNAKTRVQSLEDCLFLTSARKQQILDLLDRRWLYHRRPLHEAAAALGPRWKTEIDTNAKEGLVKVVPRFFTDDDDQLCALAEHSDWLTTASEGLALKAANKWRGEIWWHTFGTKWPRLQEVAKKILGQPASMTSCERGWSVYGAVKDKKSGAAWG